MLTYSRAPILKDCSRYKSTSTDRNFLLSDNALYFLNIPDQSINFLPTQGLKPFIVVAL
jgi:hypothetical protein